MAMSNKPASANAPRARYAYENLDRVLHERARLGILTSLVSNPAGLTFNDLKQLCDLTDGNLSRHLQLLLEHNYVEKTADKSKHSARIRMTALGRRTFFEYVAELERVVADASQAQHASQSKRVASKRATGSNSASG